ncbi:MAG: hypothetical protein ACX94C_14405 [Phycisphaerales bacterium]
MGRTLDRRHRILQLVARSGTACALIALAGCGGGGGGQARTPDTRTPVNTGLSSLANRPGLALPSEEELMELSDEEASIQERIAESARQLEFYFTNVEIDGAMDPDELEALASSQAELVQNNPPVSSSGNGSQASVTSDRPPTRVSQPKQPNPDVGGGDDGGVRFSLSDLAGDPATLSGADDEDAEAERETTADPEPVEATTTNEPAATRKPVVEPQVRRDELASELASILSEMVTLGEDPGASALALASLEMLLPEDTSTLVDSGVLSEPELATIDAVRSLLSSMTSEGTLVSPNELASRLEGIQRQLAAWSGLSIRNAALCTRVDGFGRYTTFPSYRFIAGQEHEIIVYTELEHFAQEESTGPDGRARYGIELSQRLELYHVADDLNTWNRAAERVRDESRNQLRDYYLTNRVWLPGNLGVGRYHLKIVMRDLLSDKVAETIVPIEIVAR